MEHPGSPACPEMPYFPAFFKVFSTLWEGYLVPRRGFDGQTTNYWKIKSFLKTPSPAVLALCTKEIKVFR